MKYKLALFLFLIFIVGIVAENVPGGSGGVILEEDYLEIENVIICGNEVCQEGETAINCPTDCPVSSMIFGNELLLLVIAGFAGYWFLIRKKGDKAEDERFYGDLLGNKTEKPHTKRTTEIKTEDLKSEPINEELFYKEI